MKDPRLDDRLDRCIRREMTPEQARALAQESLDNPEIFEELTYSSMARAAIEAGVPGQAVPISRKPRWLVPAGAAAAVLVAAGLYWTFASGTHLTPVIDPASAPGQPVLLASGFAPVTGVDKLPPMRGADSSGRAPQAVGIVTAIKGGEANINVGSIDGLAKGSELQVFSDVQSTEVIGRLAVATVFRERARATIRGTVKVNDHVRVAGVDFLRVLLEQVDAAALRDDLAGARETAEKAVIWADSAKLPPGERRHAVERLAAVEYRSGMASEAESHFRSVVGSLNAEPAAPPDERADAWNSFAVLHILSGDAKSAKGLLDQAHLAPGATGISVARYANSLGVLAEMRGERREAERHYADALRAFGASPDTPAQERRSIEANLARVRGSR